VSNQSLQVLKDTQGAQSLPTGNGIGWQQIKELGGILDMPLQVETARQSKQS
jgi:hypothetical protein